jgi:hypothetical protein
MEMSPSKPGGTRREAFRLHAAESNNRPPPVRIKHSIIVGINIIIIIIESTRRMFRPTTIGGVQREKY